MTAARPTSAGDVLRQVRIHITHTREAHSVGQAISPIVDIYQAMAALEDAGLLETLADAADLFAVEIDGGAE